MNVYLSVLLRPQVADVGALPPLALVAGLAVAEAIREAAPIDATLKWPNDVLIGRRKVSGILTEATDDRGDSPALVVGVGLNVNQERFPPELHDIATSMRIEAGPAFDRSVVAAHVLRRLHERTSQALEKGYEAVLEDWTALSTTIGRRVRSKDGPSGVAESVTPSGALVIRDEAGRAHHVVSGTIEEL